MWRCTRTRAHENCETGWGDRAGVVLQPGPGRGRFPLVGGSRLGPGQRLDRGGAGPLTAGEDAGAVTQDEMRRALGVGPEWRVIWSGDDPLPTVEHWCGGLYGPESTYVTETRMLPYARTRTPGVEAAPCRRCRLAWVRSVRS